MPRTPSRLLATAALALSALLAQGCGNACLSLADEICNCLPDDGTRASCKQRAKDDQANFPVRPEDEAFCQQKIDAQQCTCDTIYTPEGRLACGLSYPTN